MLEFLIVFGAGLVVGWNILPQPKWVADLYKTVISNFKNKE